MSGPMPSRWDAVVVGGGIAGLSAAWELTRAGLRPLLVEARGYTGGLVASAPIAGVPMDLGADSFADRGRRARGGARDGAPEAARSGAASGAANGDGAPDDGGLGPSSLMAELGLRTAAPSGRAHLFLPPAPDWPGGPGAPQGQEWGIHRFPADSFLGIPADPMADDVVAIIGARAARQAARDRELPGTVGTGQAGDLASFVRARMGQGVLDRLVRPVVAGIHSADPGSLAVDSVLPGLRGATARLGSLGAAVAEMLAQRRAAGQRSGDLGVVGGLFLAVEAMHRGIEAAGGTVLTRTGGQWLRSEGPGCWRLGLAPTGRGPTPSAEPVPVGPVWEVSTARLVLACSRAAALRLLEGLPGPEAQVGAPSGSPIARLILVARAPGLDEAPVGSGVLVAPTVGDGACPVEAKALSHLSAKWPWIGRALRERHGPGIHALRLSYGRPGAPRPRVDLDRALRDAGALTGVDIAPEEVIDHRLVRWDEALAPTTPEGRERVGRLEGRVAQAGGVGLTGAWVAGSGVAAVVAHARRVARGLVDGDPRAGGGTRASQGAP
ncbi:FAD-dependent oxidoreductase [Actinomyces bowdenii]|uniref:protoporphyrinogen/coproporphyrinogen oxidase n=1 Tax=Actinomyces bowdenii TaxID=131109 RepID=UPI00214C6411|nr:FAD-dependent oxidoreductase [Actinomyces bowdenii]MCR2051288.1 FAD-dependent oxidoreductase [Actinomyces bowdenii]